MPNRACTRVLLALGILIPLGCGKNITPASPGGSPAYSYPFLFNYGDTGYAGGGNGQLNTPYGIAVYNNNLFVDDFGNNRIEKFDANGNYLASFTGNPGKPLAGPDGIAVDKARRVAVYARGRLAVDPPLWSGPARGVGSEKISR